MTLYDGKELFAIYHEKKSGSFKEDIVREYFTRLAKTMYRCHANVPIIVHRDLKLENVKVPTSDNGVPLTGEILLYDFGSAYIKGLSVLEDKHASTHGYRPPECLFKRVREGYVEKADVFAFGIILHMIVLGYHPLDGTKNH